MCRRLVLGGGMGHSLPGLETLLAEGSVCYTISWLGSNTVIVIANDSDSNKNDNNNSNDDGDGAMLG